jgi:hypothetical protein
MSREAELSLFGEDNFFFDSSLPETTEKLSVVPQPPQPLYAIGYGELSAVVPQPEYHLIRNVSITILIGVIVLILVLSIWFIVSVIGSNGEINSGVPTTKTAINTFMNSVNNGGFQLLGTAIGMRRAVDCNVENNCIVAGGTQPSYNCVVNFFDPNRQEWSASTCALPNITSTYTSLTRGFDFTTLGTLVNDLDPITEQPIPVFYDPSTVWDILNQNPSVLAVIYDTSRPGPDEEGDYATYLYTSKSSTKPEIDVSTLASHAIPFELATKGLILFVRTPEYLNFGQRIVLSYTPTPTLTDLISAPTPNTTVVPLGNTFFTNQTFELFNFNNYSLNIVTPQKTTVTSVNFVPYGNLGSQGANITVNNTPPTSSGPVVLP